MLLSGVLFLGAGCMLSAICWSQGVLTLLAFVAGWFFPQVSKKNQIALIALFLITTILLFYYIYNKLRMIRKGHRFSQLARSFLAVSSEVDEIFVLDEALRVVYAKSGPRDHFSFEEVIGAQLEDHHEALEACERALAQGLFYEEIFRARSENSWEDDSFVRVRILPLFTTSPSTPTYRAVILSDVTLCQRSEQGTTASESILERYLDYAPFGLVYVDVNGVILGANDVFRRWIQSGFLGKSLLAFLEGPLSMQTLLGNRSGLQVVLKTGVFKKKLKLFTTLIGKNSIAITLYSMDDNSGSEDLLELLPVPSLMVDSVGCVQKVNTALKTLLAKQKHRLLEGGQLLSDALDEPSRKNWQNALKMGGSVRRAFELHFENSDFTVLGALKKLDAEQWLVQLMDTSEQKKLEQQFVQAQKTQAVGQLAGGIAHDFNNLLTAIIGFCDLILQRVMPNDPSFVDIMHIKQNANRAANLVRQLLAFSRRQSLQPRRIDVAEVMSDLSALLKRLIGSQIEFRLNQNRHLWPIKVDVGQFEQVIINLVVNARDAMPKGGTLTLETSNFTNKVPKNLGNDIMLPGDYVLISVQDTGCGIAPDLIKSIFEPFFSTKPKGQGTGLGLATVYGIVKQTGGAIDVASQVDVGSTFKVYLPRCCETETQNAVERKRVQDITGTETILLVEDEDAVRIFASRALRDKGYRVLEAANGKAALSLLQEGAKPNILVTDVSMPEMDGPTLSQEVKKLFPNLPVIFMSGYAEETFRNDLSQNQKMHFLTKPFTLRELATKVRAILEQERCNIGTTILKEGNDA